MKNRKDHNIGPNNIFVAEMIPEEQKYKHPVILVHGSFGGFFMWKLIANKLTDAGFHCYVPSLRGHSPNPKDNLGKLHMQDYVDDVKAVVDAFDLENPTLIGHSMSGLVVLMYAKDNPVSNLICIDPSQSLEIQGHGDEEKIKNIPDIYTPTDAGMPTDPLEVMKALPDMPQEILMKMKEMLGPESGMARRDRKRGISIPKESINMPCMFLGAELGNSLSFGISFEKTQMMADFYGKELIEIKSATHPGIIMGTHAPETAEHIINWLNKQ